MVLAAMLFIKRVSETSQITAVDQSTETEGAHHSLIGKEIPKGVMVYRMFERCSSARRTNWKAPAGETGTRGADSAHEKGAGHGRHRVERAETCLSGCKERGNTCSEWTAYAAPPGWIRLVSDRTEETTFARIDAALAGRASLGLPAEMESSPEHRNTKAGFA
jgi:hypothetical protein